MTAPPLIPLTERIEHALRNAAHTHPCTSCGSTTWASCFHDGKLSDHQVRRAAAVLAVVQPELDAAHRAARASEESATILQRQIDAQAAELDARTAELAAMTDLRDRAIARQDQLREQLADARNSALDEAAAVVHSLPPATTTGDDQHWYRFGQNRAADAILAARTQPAT